MFPRHEAEILRISLIEAMGGLLMESMRIDSTIGPLPSDASTMILECIQSQPPIDVSVFMEDTQQDQNFWVQAGGDKMAVALAFFTGRFQIHAPSSPLHGFGILDLSKEDYTSFCTCPVVLRFAGARDEQPLYDEKRHCIYTDESRHSVH